MGFASTLSLETGKAAALDSASGHNQHLLQALPSSRVTIEGPGDVSPSATSQLCQQNGNGLATGDLQSVNALPSSGSLLGRASEDGESSNSKESSLAALRAQIAACELRLQGNSQTTDTSAAVAEPPHPDPERTGPWTGEEELAWIVREMELHRAQIQAHQQKLWVLEKRHAEIVSGMPDDAQQPDDAPNSTKLESGDCQSPRYLGAEPVPSTASVDSCSAAALAAAEKRLGLKLAGSSRPASASSSQIPLAASLPNSGGTRSLRSSVVGKDKEELFRELSLGVAALGGKPPPPLSGSGAITATRSVSLGGSVASLDAPSIESGVAGPMIGSSEEEGLRIGTLLEQFLLQRPLQVGFVLMETPGEASGEPGTGRRYLHGDLELRLFLDTTCEQLLVGVGSSGSSGRLMYIEEFVDRAEAIRAQRPSPILEEVEGLGQRGGTVDPAGAAICAAMLAAPVGTGPGPKTASAWKHLFKSHWDSR